MNPNHKAIATIVLIVSNFSALVWGAAKISSSVDSLKRNQDKVGIVLDNVAEKIIKLDTRVTVLETIQSIKQHGN